MPADHIVGAGAILKRGIDGCFDRPYHIAYQFSLSAASAARKLLGDAGLPKRSVDSLYTLLGLHRM
ncbi:hypothetical protein FE783_15535 [Paenibacillus mesophilus]|uniref:hypothetical protein n=1 Tax=Paenibacillus mesophilus TaxID=2582849 RepID=UPI00110DED00|nr:hypothetical protein [Paenibacillus mesophilus]TMV49079.1 hypothetical protein FE783_15535 [Paenibacillus mesophilus]